MQEEDFWGNVQKFARFFISASSGLIFGLLSPFGVLTRTPTGIAIGSTLLVGTIIFFVVTLQTMQQTPAEVAAIAASEPTVDAMLREMYGPQ